MRDTFEKSKVDKLPTKKMTIVLLSTAVKTACKNSNRFKSYGSFNKYANFSNVEKPDVSIKRFISHNAAFYVVSRGIKI